MNVAPGATYEAVVDFGVTGATLGLRVVDNAGATTIARATTNITEYPAGSGIYARTGNVAPTVAGQYTIVWDDGSVTPGHVATEDLFVTSSSAAAVSASHEYVAVATLKATLSLTGETFADDDVAVAVTAASRAIDDACNRRFWKDSADATRYYTPQTSTICRIDDLADFTSLETDQNGDGTFEQTWTENTDFFFTDLNAEADGWPRTRITVHPLASLRWPSYPRSVKLVGKYGWDTTPDAIVQATGILASRLLKRSREAPFGVASIGIDGAGVRVPRLDPDVEALIRPYRRLTV